MPIVTRFVGKAKGTNRLGLALADLTKYYEDGTEETQRCLVNWPWPVGWNVRSILRRQPGYRAETVVSTPKEFDVEFIKEVTDGHGTEADVETAV